MNFDAKRELCENSVALRTQNDAKQQCPTDVIQSKIGLFFCLSLQDVVLFSTKITNYILEFISNN